MPPDPEPFAGVEVGQRLGPVTFAVSGTANERYWAAAGVEHPLRAAGALYPPMGANLTILLFQTVYPRPMLQTTQRLVCHQRADADQTVSVTGMVAQRYEKRGREYAVIQAVIALEDQSPLWTSIVTFTEAGVPARSG